jgi:hypothetical protein
MRARRRLPLRQSPKVVLNLMAPDGGVWGLEMSAGTERFIGRYSQVPGLDADGPLLEYQPLGWARSG